MADSCCNERPTQTRVALASVLVALTSIAVSDTLTLTLGEWFLDSRQVTNLMSMASECEGHNRFERRQHVAVKCRQ